VHGRPHLIETSLLVLPIGTLSIDNEIHDDDVRNRRRIGLRVSFSSEKTKVKQCVCFEETTSFGSLTSCSCYGFQKTRILLLINYNDGFIDGDEFVVLYGFYASKNLNFP